ncbi:MAG: DUF924 family protein [Paracoccaceae bacterium]
MSRIDDVLQFWLEDTPESQWYRPADGLDDRLRALFAADWGRAAAGLLEGWRDTARGALAYIVLTDQFPRNMFRGRALSFATDAQALNAARAAIEAGHDTATGGPGQQFFYMPFNHSENLADQDRCVALTERLGEAESLLHAEAHRRVIADFGRFPFRNAALGRLTTPQEQAFLDGGGYAGLVERMKASHAGTA